MRTTMRTTTAPDAFACGNDQGVRYDRAVVDAGHRCVQRCAPLPRGEPAQPPPRGRSPGRDRQAQVVPLSGSADALAGLTATLFSGHLRGGKVVGCTSLQYCVRGIFRLFHPTLLEVVR